MRSLTLSVIVASLAFGSGCQEGARHPSGLAFTELPRAAPDLSSLLLLPFERTVTILGVDPAKSSLDAKTVAQGVCKPQTDCTFTVSVTLYRAPEPRDGLIMAVRYVLLSPTGRAEGFAVSNARAGIAHNEHWQISGRRWKQLKRGTKEYIEEDDFAVGLWHTVLRSTRQETRPSTTPSGAVF